MQFKHGADVKTADGRGVGSVDRVVMDPRTREVSHIVVRKGVLFVDDKVVPVDWISSATEDQVTLRMSESELEKLPNFVETEYIPVGGPGSTTPTMALPLYWYPPVGSATWGYPALTGYPSAVPVAGERQIPEGEIALHEGAPVMTLDGKHAGDVERVFVEETTNRATHFVLTKGLLFPEKKLLPMAWVKSVGDEQVLLNVEADILEQVRPYQD